MQKRNETGRSMIEMLAVLVIFALLSLVGIKGFDYMKGRQAANEMMKVVYNIYNVSKTKGYSTTTYYERMPVPKGVARMDVDLPEKTVTIYAGVTSISDSTIKTMKAYFNKTITEETVTQTINGKSQDYKAFRIQM